MSRVVSRLPLWSLAIGVVLSTSALAEAQDVVPPPPPPSDPAAAPAMPPPSPAAMPPASEAPPAVAVIAPPAAEKGEAPVPKTVAPSSIKVNFGVRVGARLQNLNEPDKLNRLSLDTIYAEPRFSGEVTENFSWQVNLNVGLNPGDTLSPTNAVGIMDLIGQLKVSEGFNVWAGRLLVPSDRSNFSGPFFMSAWNYPGFYTAGAPLGPKDGANGRDNGAVVWGDFLDGKVKYHLGAFGLDRTAAAKSTPYFSGRLNFCLLGSEPGFYHSSTYYGSQDIVAVGVGAQYQKDGAVDAGGQTKDMVNVMADVLAEGKVGDSVLTLEGQYYHFNEGSFFDKTKGGPDNAFYVLASYLSPQVGIGKLQPLVRVQHTIDPDWTIVDAFLTYVIKGYDLRVHAGYQRTDAGGPVAANAIQLGVQLQK